MLEKFEKKIATTIHTFFVFGLVSVGLGFLTLSNELFARFFIAVGFFLIGILFLHISYHVQDLRNRLSDLISNVEKPLVEPIINAVKRATAPERKKKTVRRKALTV